MKALVYKATGELELQDRPRPQLAEPTDAIIRMVKTTICGTDLHIKKGDVATAAPGRVLGHEGVGVVEETGSSVRGFKAGDRVLISCISSCGTCRHCRTGMYSHCSTGGWLLGNTVDGTQAEYVRIPHADSSLFPVLPGVDEGAQVMLSDALPTGYECGVLNGKVQPGSAVAVIGAGPVGLSAVITAQMYSPSILLAIDNDESRLQTAKELGATHACTAADAAELVKSLTIEGQGCDTVIEAVGIPATFEMAQKLLAPGGTLANLGVHGTKVDLYLNELWDRNVSITTRLVDTVSTPMLLRIVAAGKLNPEKLITHSTSPHPLEPLRVC